MALLIITGTTALLDLWLSHPNYSNTLQFRYSPAACPYLSSHGQCLRANIERHIRRQGNPLGSDVDHTAEDVVLAGQSPTQEQPPAQLRNWPEFWDVWSFLEKIPECRETREHGHRPEREVLYPVGVHRIVDEGFHVEEGLTAGETEQQTNLEEFIMFYGILMWQNTGR